MLHISCDRDQAICQENIQKIKRLMRHHYTDEEILNEFWRVHPADVMEWIAIAKGQESCEFSLI